jgi:hypothetical protein
MPQPPTPSTVVKIKVTLVPDLASPLVTEVQTYDYSYKSPDLINIIPLYKGDRKFLQFTGNNLGAIQYIQFVDSSTSQLTAEKLPVSNVTSTSFQTDFSGVTMNNTRCLLLDAFGNVTTEDADYFSISSETCFLGGTPVMTDQGEVPIDKIDPMYHTIDQQEIVAITKTRYNQDTIIRLPKDSLRKNYPSRDTVISRKHKIYYKGKMKRAEQLVGKGAEVIPYKRQYLYNVLLRTHGVMRVNGLVCETLYPSNPIAKFFTMPLDQCLIQESLCDSRVM